MDLDCIESLEQFWKNWHLNNIESCNPRTSNASLFIYIFSFSLKCLTVFSVQVLNYFCEVYLPEYSLCIDAVVNGIAF